MQNTTKWMMVSAVLGGLYLVPAVSAEDENPTLPDCGKADWDLNLQHPVPLTTVWVMTYDCLPGQSPYYCYVRVTWYPSPDVQYVLGSCVPLPS